MRADQVGAAGRVRRLFVEFEISAQRESALDVAGTVIAAIVEQQPLRFEVLSVSVREETP